MRKKAASIALVCMLVLGMTIPVFADGNATVNLVVHPVSGLTMTFDSFNFEGAVGEKDLHPTVYKDGSATVTTPGYDIRYHNNYSVYVSGNNFTTSAGDSTLNIGRLSINAFDTSGKPVNTNPISISTTQTTMDTQSNAGYNTAARSVQFSLDLTTTTGNGYSDNATLSALGDTTDYSTTITLSFTSI